MGAAMTLEELLETMRRNERVSVVQLEPRDVTRWREAVELLAQEVDDLRRQRIGAASMMRKFSRLGSAVAEAVRLLTTMQTPISATRVLEQALDENKADVP